MIVIDVGHSKIKVWNEETNKISYFLIEQLNDLYQYLIQQDSTIYIGSVNKEVSKQITQYLDNKQNYKLITHDHFNKNIKLNQNINIYEVGLDILSIVYYVDDENYIFVNSGTALVYIKYTNQLDGVIISNNIFVNTLQLLQDVKLNYSYTNNDGFAQNTNDAFSSSINLQFIFIINQLLLENKITKLYVNNIENKYLKNIQAGKIEMINEATLKGYIKLIKKNNI